MKDPIRCVAACAAVLILQSPAFSADEEVIFNPADSQIATTEAPAYKTTFPDAPGMEFDIPPDMKVTKKNNSFEVESTTHYLYRKLKEQDELLAGFNAKLGAIQSQVQFLEGRVNQMEQQKSAPQAAAQKLSLRSVETPTAGS